VSVNFKSRPPLADYCMMDRQRQQVMWAKHLPTSQEDTFSSWRVRLHFQMWEDIFAPVKEQPFSILEIGSWKAALGPVEALAANRTSRAEVQMPLAQCHLQSTSAERYGFCHEISYSASASNAC
jgi:hypothetical protein